MTPFKCPVCEGRGIVAADFYDDVGPDIPTCRACQGKGIVWSPEEQPCIPYPYPWYPYYPSYPIILTNVPCETNGTFTLTASSGTAASDSKGAK